MDEKLERSISCDDERVEYINGAFGGLGPNNELLVTFFHEHLDLNYSMLHEDETPKVIRDVKGTFVMNFESVTKIYDWLANQIKAVNENKNSNGGE